MADKTLLDLSAYSDPLTGDELLHIIQGATGLEVDYKMTLSNLLTYLMAAVHCRTGSLERTPAVVSTPPPVHCRTGSLETFKESRDQEDESSLPHRQLRNYA